MTISASSWVNFVNKLTVIDDAATKKVADYINLYGGSFSFDNAGHMKALIEYSYTVSQVYGEAAAELACEMYDEIGASEQLLLDSAVPSEPPTYAEVAKTMNGIRKVTQNVDAVAAQVGRLTKKTAARTTLQNAQRDHAQVAWIVHGDTCPFCLTLASRGWEDVSPETDLDGKMVHIHGNCDCTYGVRHKNDTKYAGYNPDKYLEMYDNAEGKNSKEKIRYMRRQHYAENKDEINAQKRAAYAEKRLKNEGENGTFKPRKDVGGYLVTKNEFINAIEKEPSIFGKYTPSSLKQELENMGYEVKPLSRGNFKNVPFENGGGYKVNYDGDGLLGYHPEERSHHGGAYYKLSKGKGGEKRYDLDGKEIFD